ncbi:MAG: hypothetical protein DMF84_07775 [Acidobacteria bacterium]|nr:MAG: hypothetical protein DMF84_07775 [Acidobacteriota bacterium]
MKRTPKLTVRAHAKVNLDLRVLGVRSDGYHELRTVFQTIELHDTLVCAETPGPFTIRCRTPNVPLDASNLIWTSAAALWTALGRAGDVRDTTVAIDKKIPLEAGLGGGSADAAAALVALARLWGGAPMTLLRELSTTIGADVPFFLSGGTALGLVPRDRSSSLWRFHGRSVRVVRRRPRRGSARGARAAVAPRPVAEPRGADDQRSRAACRPAPSGDLRP